MHNNHLGTATVLSLWSSCEFDRRLVELNQWVIHWSTTKEYWRPKQTVILRPGRKSELVSKTMIPTKINKRKQRTEKNTKKWEPSGWMQWYSPVAFNKCIHRSLIRSWHISWGSRCNCGEAEGKGGALAHWAGSEPVGWVLACCCSPEGWGGCRNAAPMSGSSAPWCLKPSRIPLPPHNELQNLAKPHKNLASWVGFHKMIPEQTSQLKNKLNLPHHLRSSGAIVALSQAGWWLGKRQPSVHKNSGNTKPSSQTTTHHSGLNLALSGWN